MAARERQKGTYKGVPIRMSAGFSTKTLQARRDWHAEFKVMEIRDLKTRLLYPVRVSFKIEGEIKSIQNKKGYRST